MVCLLKLLIINELIYKKITTLHALHFENL